MLDTSFVVAIGMCVRMVCGRRLLKFDEQLMTVGFRPVQEIFPF
jgi:hypothetical protein